MRLSHPYYTFIHAQVLLERGRWREDLKGDCKAKQFEGRNIKHAVEGGDLYQKCCVRKLMANEPDFGEQLCWLEEVITAAGHKTIFLPKFHPELNAIERYWGGLKKITRWRCDDSIYSLRELVDAFLNSDVHCNLTSIRKYFRICWRYMDAYKEGMSAELAKYAVTLYKSHRMVSGSLDKRIEDAISLAFAKEVEREERREGGGEGEEEEEQQQEEGEGVTAEEQAEITGRVREIVRGGRNEDGESEEMDEETMMRGIEEESG